MAWNVIFFLLQEQYCAAAREFQYHQGFYMIDDCFALGKPVTVDMKHTAAPRMASWLLVNDWCIMKLLTACQSVLTAALPVDDFLARRSGN
jgi:hypothetical protein